MVQLMKLNGNVFNLVHTFILPVQLIKLNSDANDSMKEGTMVESLMRTASRKVKWREK